MIRLRRRPLYWGLAPLLLIALAPTANAIDAVVLEVRELEVAGIPIEGAKVQLDLVSDRQARVTVSARGVKLADPIGKLTQLRLVCASPVIAEPRFGCGSGTLTGRGGPTGSIDMKVAAEMRTDTGVTTFSGKGLRVAGTSASFSGSLDAKGWRVKADSGATSVAELLKFIHPWFALPKGFTVDGKVALGGVISDEGKGLLADGTAKLRDLSFSNEAGDIVGEKVELDARLKAGLGRADMPLELHLDGTQGQALLSIIFLDLGKNATTIDAKGVMKGNSLAIDSLHLLQKDLADIEAHGALDLAPEIPAFTGEVHLARMEFPAAYTTYMANALAQSMLGDMKMSGSLTGEVSLAANAPLALHLAPENLDLRDNKGRFELAKLNGAVNWAPAGAAAPQPSSLSWERGGGFGLSGGAARLDFVTQGAGFTLTRPAKLPILDGALAVEKFSMDKLGADDMEVAFKGEVEPISMPLLAKAFGWPPFSGTLAARIPGVTLKDKLLTFQGNVESQVFGGQLVGSNIRLQDPLGPLPRFFADVRARNLDLGLITRTFDVGSITGKLDVDVLGLALVAWTPEAFDARLATPKGDRSRHRISAKAVSSLSNVGGGGGGVVQALQSGLLRFFDEYSYDKLGITCKLRNYVCEMSGIEPAGVGYYIVKGAGIPRIDIVGNQGRVNWTQLMSSIPTDFSNVTVK